MIKVEQKKTVEIKMTETDNQKLKRLAYIQQTMKCNPVDFWMFETLLNNVANDVLIDNVVINDIKENSRSSYTLEKSEIQVGIVKFLMTKIRNKEYCKIHVRHDRGNMPHSYKYKPTSQHIEICLQKELKNSIRINIFQAIS